MSPCLCLPVTVIAATATPPKNLPTQTTMKEEAKTITVHPTKLRALAAISNFFLPIKSISFPNFCDTIY